jgi:organic hydroperoxide reductase OsmC/OhrA
VPAKAKEFRYAIAVDLTGRITADGRAALQLDPAWTPEHLVLAGLTRCTLQSLGFHAAQAAIEFAAAASASALVTKREEDGRYAFVEIGIELDVEIERVPPADELRALIQKAERDCFVGASLNPAPRYRWRVNGRDA